MKRYFAKENTWFKAGTEAFLDTDFSPMKSGLFYGKLEITNAIAHNYPMYNIGDIIDDGEICSYDEFEIVEVVE